MSDFQAYKHPHFDEACRTYAPLLIKQGPDWSAGHNGKLWHSSGSRFDLLVGLSSKKQEESWL
jgi:hypothetical protein